MSVFVRILVVDDYEPFRRFVCSELRQRADFQVIGEVPDGLEAVRKANELQPDLVLMDINLPGLDGLEAARRIRKAAPQVKLLFISLESSASFVQEVLRLGAHGYIDKLRADVDLLPAIESVLGGRQFISASLKLGEIPHPPARHDVHFYSDDFVFLEGVTPFIMSALNSGNAAVVLATESHRAALVERLKAFVDIDRAMQHGTYAALDAAAVLSHIMIKGWPDRARFLEGLSDQIDRVRRTTRKEQPRIAIFGECAGLLSAEGNTKAAIELEKTADDLIQAYPVEILCAYPSGLFPNPEQDYTFKAICAEHTGRI